MPSDDRALDRARAPESGLDLPPLPTLKPLPAIRPMTPMPRPPWEADPVPPWHSASAAGPAAQSVMPTVMPSSAPPLGSVAASRLAVPPPPAGHPAAASTATGGMTAVGEVTAVGGAAAATDHRPEHSWEPVFGPEPAAARLWSPPRASSHTPAAQSTSYTPVPDPAPLSDRSRHLPVEELRHTEQARGLRVLVMGGSEPLGGMVAERLIGAGHRLAVSDVAIPSDITPQRDRDGVTVATSEPISLHGDRSDTEDVVHTVARAEVALGGLDALVILPAAHHTPIGLDADAATWADEWSLALTTEVLATAAAAHIAARSFLARRRAGRIILVASGRDGSRSGVMPTATVRATLGRLGADLGRELAPHGIGVSVVTTGPGGAADFAVGQVADVVEALLATPVLSGMNAHID